MADRYYVESPVVADRAVLAGPEAHHLIHVMRAKPGSLATLFDGSGWEFDARVERVGRAEVELAIMSRNQVDRELPIRLTLGVALPKGDRQKWLVEKAVELGVTRLVPLETARGVAQGVEKALDRLRRSVVEASKQCGRNRLMEIAAPQPWAAYVAGMAEVPHRLLAHPGHSTGGEDASVKRLRLTECAAVATAVGPEGGFTDEEVALAIEAGWQPIDLGRRILRIETAAVLLSAMIAVSSRP